VVQAEAYAEFQVSATCSLKVQKSQQVAATNQAFLGSETTLVAVANVRMNLTAKFSLFLKTCIMIWCITATGWLSARAFA
jgi:hypothetical protein